MLVGVDERVVDADVGERADEDQGGRAERLEDELELSREERRIPTLADQELLGPGIEPVGQFGRRVALEAVDALGPVELAADVEQRRLVDLLDEDHGDAVPAGDIDDLPDQSVAGLTAGHDRDAVGVGHDLALLDVDHDQGCGAG